MRGLAPSRSPAMAGALALPCDGWRPRAPLRWLAPSRSRMGVGARRTARLVGWRPRAPDRGPGPAARHDCWSGRLAGDVDGGQADGVAERAVALEGRQAGAVVDGVPA